ncbi:hypothetical protein FRB90_000271 [Tulasnella sp. 427]|nr:hypothetical protein FRB90_000271 [Tulasnella sp. 427]
MDHHTSFWGLAQLGFKDGREEALQNAKVYPSGHHRHELPPDDQIMCFDNLYYVGASKLFEWEKDYSPAWRFVGKHARFHPKMVKLAEQYLRKAFGLSDGELIPKFISMHIRHGDFKNDCKDTPKEYCMAPLSTLAKAVEQVRETLKSQRGVLISGAHVLITSDEEDPAWWAEVDRLGWSYINHGNERTVEKYGKWLPIFIDAMHQSMGTGFVGTLGSTMSLVALRRVMDWNGGFGVMVPFGPNMYAPKSSSF